jgi:hypothetical protein
MIRVVHGEVLAARQRLDARGEVVQHDGEVLWVPPGRLEAEPCRSKCSDGDEGQLKRTSGGCWASSSSGTSRTVNTDTP